MSEEGEEVFSLWSGAMVTATVVGAVVVAALLWVVVRYRRRGDELPSQRAYHVPLEVVLTAIPVVIVAGLFGFSYRAQRAITDTVDDPDVVVDVVGFQWQWRFDYPEEGVSVIGTPDELPTLVLPVGETVRLNLLTSDVIHSFWVPRFLTKRDMLPDVDNAIDVHVSEEGRWRGRCAEFCGLEHWRMLFDVHAVPPEEFDDWLDEQRGAAAGEGPTAA